MKVFKFRIPHAIVHFAMNTFRAIKLIPWCALSLAKEFLDSWLLALHILHETMKLCLKWSRCGTHVLHVRCLKAIASTPKLAALQRRHYWKKNYVVVSHVAMFSQVRILALPWKCHKKGKILFFFRKFEFPRSATYQFLFCHAIAMQNCLAMFLPWQFFGHWKLPCNRAKATFVATLGLSFAAYFMHSETVVSNQ